MSAQMVGIIGIVVVTALLFSRMWIGLSMMLVGFFGSWYLADWNTAMSIVGVVPFSQSMIYALTCMPMFILMGIVLAMSGLGGDLYDFASKWMGRIRGSLAMATLLACGFFSAVCGDSVTTAVTMGKVSYPEMKRHKYADSIALGSISAGGTVGVLIPPSICFIIYGLITQQSIGALFMAGVIPGITQVLFYMITIAVIAKIKPHLIPKGEKVQMVEKIKSTKTIWPVAILFIVVMSGIYLGWFTPTEAGAIGASVSIIITLLNRRIQGKLSASFIEALKNSAMVYFLIVGAYVFLRFLALTKLPANLGNAVMSLYTNYGFSRLWIILALALMYIVFGAFLDVLACILLTLGIVYPIVEGLGFSLIWFGVIVVRLMEIGMISPPLGLNLFAVTKTTKTSISSAFKGILPFLIADGVHLLLLVFFPSLSLWIPSLMKTTFS